MNSEYLVDDILPCREVHLLAGSSGSGKTTWLFQTIADWQDGRPILGHNSHPVPYAYVSIDRSFPSVARTLQRLGLDNKITRLVCREDLPKDLSVESVISAAHTKFPDSKLYFIEGFLMLVGSKAGMGEGGNSYLSVASLLSSTTAICARLGITILGVCHSPKLKEGEKFRHARESVLGSAAWGGFSDTTITMDLDEKKNVITMLIMPRNAPKEEYRWRFGTNGVLKLYKPFGKGKEEVQLYIYGLEAGTIVSKSDIVEVGEIADVSLRTVETTIAEAIDDGFLETVGRGVYRRLPEPLLN
jgi:RecA-family ATPase